MTSMPDGIDTDHPKIPALRDAPRKDGIAPQDVRVSIRAIMARPGDPDDVIPVVPQIPLDCAQLTHETGAPRNRTDSWKDPYFPDIHDQTGNWSVRDVPGGYFARPSSPRMPRSFTASCSRKRRLSAEFMCCGDHRFFSRSR